MLHTMQLCFVCTAMHALAKAIPKAHGWNIHRSCGIQPQMSHTQIKEVTVRTGFVLFLLALIIGAVGGDGGVPYVAAWLG